MPIFCQKQSFLAWKCSFLLQKQVKFDFSTRLMPLKFERTPAFYRGVYGNAYYICNYYIQYGYFEQHKIAYLNISAKSYQKLVLDEDFQQIYTILFHSSKYCKTFIVHCLRSFNVSCHCSKFPYFILITYLLGVCNQKLIAVYVLGKIWENCSFES